LTDSLLWDTGCYYNCSVDFKDYVDLARYWWTRYSAAGCGNPPCGGPSGDGMDGVDIDALARFADEWLTSSRI
jgi:hypothetical protein